MKNNRQFKSIRGLVHANLAAAMIISTCIFLTGIEKANDKVKSNNIPITI